MSRSMTQKWGQAPKQYKAGLGRGAAGFTTRSDIGNVLGGGGVGSGSTTATTGDDVDAVGGGSRAAEQRAAKLQMKEQMQGPTVSPWGQAPANYKPGAGRGASKMGEDSGSGFTGNTAAGPIGANAGGRNNNNVNDDGNDDDAAPPSFNAAMEMAGQYDDDDQEADMIWAAIDQRLQHRRKNKRKVKEGPRLDYNNNNNNDDDNNNNNNDLDDAQAHTRRKIQRQFHDAKEQLATVSEQDWMNIPDPQGDYSLRFKRQEEKRKNDVFTPITDTLLESRSQLNNGRNASLNASIPDTNGGTTTTTTTTATLTNMSGLGVARGTVLGMSLDKMSDSVSGQTNVDPQGYLTSMSTINGGTSTVAGGENINLGDVNKARLLLKSVRDTNPNHGPGWIASARVEEAAGKILKARKLIQEGCMVCPTHADVWLEAARLHPTTVAKSILATAVRRIPHSVPLFLKAADLESHVDAKKAVLRKALEANPTSLTLWKSAIELEDDSENAKILLGVAVEKIPTAVELWLALARLETYQNAQKVLNKARRTLPAEKAIWIAASQLEESQQHLDRVDKIIDHAFKSLAHHEAVVTRDQWLTDAEESETAGAPATSAAIIHRAIGLGVDAEDRQRTWSEDAKSALSRGAVATARAMLAHALKTFPTKRSLWLQAVDLERNHGTQESLDQVLEAASERLPLVELFWLLRAKEQWLAGHVDVAREILTQAFSANPDSESVWLAAAKLEWETGEIERARVLLQRARERAPTERVYMKSALLEREQHEYTAALKLLEDGIWKYPKFPKFYMMSGQIYSNDIPGKKKSHLEKARKTYQEGLEKCPNNIPLWILASRLEESAHTFVDQNTKAGTGVTKARSLLEIARLKNPKNDELWLEAIRLEKRSNNPQLAETLMARALQECPTSGRLLSENILTAPRVEQKSKSADAIKRNPESPFVIAAVATLFASDRKTDKARKWFERAVLLDQDLGDSWAKYYAFELANGTIEQQKAVKDRCIKAEPKHGELWQAIVKDMEYRHKSVGECLELVANAVKNGGISTTVQK